MSRYTAVMAETVRELSFEERGWMWVQCAPREQPEVIAVLTTEFPDRPWIELAGGTEHPSWEQLGDAIAAHVAAGHERVTGAFLSLAPDLPREEIQRRFAELNVRRDFFGNQGLWTFVGSRDEIHLFERYAGDIASVIPTTYVVPFVPRKLDADELRAARNQLADHYRLRFGKLDLRGFIQSESEDSSFLVEKIYQPLQARSLGRAYNENAGNRDRTTVAPQIESAPLVDLLSANNHPALIRGGPGSGKSFFLRWCALEGASAPLFLGQPEPFPVFISLAVLNQARGTPSLEEHTIELLLAERLACAHAFAELAEHGRLLFLLDGVDEVVDGFRHRMIESIAALHQRYPRGRVIATTRPTSDVATTAFATYELAHLSKDAITALLTAWCELYERQRVGTDEAALQGRQEGVRLAAQVQANPAIHGLAETPLLATIIAIVHRAGVRLPDHRVELYDHIVRILVERWNQVRTRTRDETQPPIRLSDAIRLLGPIALELTESQRDAGIGEATLHDLLSSRLASGSVRGFNSASAAIALFRDSLGLLVETAPGVYGFLHKTIAEFLAAHEAVRTNRLLAIASDRGACFEPRWREVVLLGIGIVGLHLASDDRLDELITAIATSAHLQAVQRGSIVPGVLTSILTDDASLSHRQALSLAEELVPRWWLEGVSSVDPLFEVANFVFGMQQLSRSRWSSAVYARLRDCYASGLAGASGLASFISDPYRAFVAWDFACGALARVGISWSALLCEALTSIASSHVVTPALRLSLFQVDRTEDRASVVVGFGNVSDIPVLMLALGHRGMLAIQDDVGTHPLVAIDAPRPRLETRISASSRDSLMLIIQPHTLSDVLAVWQSIAHTYEIGPKPPATIEEAVARYRRPPSVTIAPTTI